MITEIKIQSTEDLFRELNGLPNNYIYRGQSDAQWTLQPSLERLLQDPSKRDSLVKLETYSLRSFMSKFHLYDTENNQRPDSKLAWLAAMQHYGVPTRLLDFSESPYIALYFALESHTPLSHSDFALYAIDHSAVMQASIESIKVQIPEFNETRETVYLNRDKIFDKTIDRSSLDILWITEPRVVNTRVDKQAGTFLVSGNRKRTIDELIQDPIYKDCSIKKYIIPESFFDGIFAMLRKANITAKSMYGDLFGLAGSIRMELRVYS